MLRGISCLIGRRGRTGGSRRRRRSHRDLGRCGARAHRTIIDDHWRQVTEKFDFTVGATGRLRTIIASSQRTDLVHKPASCVSLPGIWN
jgi:hypothetical protein